MLKKEVVKKPVKKAVKEKPTRGRKFTFQTVKGMKDILPQDQWVWDKIRQEVDDLACHYNFLRIDTPILEVRSLFERGVGEATEIVEKQMFRISDTNDDLVMRPENTAGVIRSYLENGLSHLGQPVKLYYIGPMFRHEQPQEGRWRQFYQAGFEIIGGDRDPIYDTQIILAGFRFLEDLKIKDLEIQINTIGSVSDRANYRRRLHDYYRGKDVCKDCKQRLVKNPLRVLDCKEERCRELLEQAPNILDNISSDSSNHFKLVLEYLDELKLPYSLNNKLVRGLDYYSHTVFEIMASDWDLALASGGRYDGLAELLGGRKTPAIGVAIGLDRVAKMVKDRGITFPIKCNPKVFLIHVGGLAKKKSLVIMEQLKRANVFVEEALGKSSLKAQLRQADKDGARLALIFGQREAFEDSIIVRDMETGVQETVPIDKLVAAIRKSIK